MFLANLFVLKDKSQNNFFILRGSTPFRLKLKEAMHRTWKKPSLNKQHKHVSISITV